MFIVDLISCILEAILHFHNKTLIKPSKSSTSSYLLSHGLVTTLVFLIYNKIPFHYSPLTIKYYFWLHPLIGEHEWIDNIEIFQLYKFPTLTHAHRIGVMCGSVNLLNPTLLIPWKFQQLPDRFYGACHFTIMNSYHITLYII